MPLIYLPVTVSPNGARGPTNWKVSTPTLSAWKRNELARKVLTRKQKLRFRLCSRSLYENRRNADTIHRLASRGQNPSLCTSCQRNPSFIRPPELQACQ